MNWKNVKIYLIILLAAVNIFFAASYIMSMTQTTHLDEEDLRNTVEFMNKNNVNIKYDAVPDKLFQTAIVECPLGENYYETVAEKIRNCERENINILPDESIRITMKDGSYFIFDSKFGLSFNSILNTSFLYTESTSNDSSKITISFSDVQLSDTQKTALEAFIYPDKNNISKCFSYFIKSSYADMNGYVYAECMQTVYDTELNNNILLVKFYGDSVVSVTGSWFFPSAYEEYSYELYDQLSILVKDIQNSVTNSKDESNTGSYYTVESVSYIYCIYWGSNKDRIFLIPAWKISTDQPAERIYNAVNCELYE